MSLTSRSEFTPELSYIRQRLRAVHDGLLFSQRQQIARAITAIDNVIGEDTPKRKTDRPVCKCGRAEFVGLLGTGEEFLLYEKNGQDVLGNQCPHCGQTAKQVREAPNG